MSPVKPQLPSNSKNAQAGCVLSVTLKAEYEYVGQHSAKVRTESQYWVQGIIQIQILLSKCDWFVL
jgi:hypothetical protein